MNMHGGMMGGAMHGPTSPAPPRHAMPRPQMPYDAFSGLGTTQPQGQQQFGYPQQGQQRMGNNPRRGGY